MKKIAVLVSGGGSNLQSLIDNTSIKDNIKLVISNKDDAYGLVRANTYQIDNYVIKKDDDKLLECLLKYEIDLIVLAGYLALIDKKIVEAFPNKIINIHPALIPSFCGKKAYGINVHKMAFEKGVKVSGATIHFVNALYDEGMIIAQEAVDISDCNSPQEIADKVLKVEHKLLPEVVLKLCNNQVKINDGRVKVE